MLALGPILQTLTEFDPAIGIYIAAAVVLVYTFAGGM
jgi:Na+/proline symporter